LCVYNFEFVSVSVVLTCVCLCLCVQVFLALVTGLPGYGDTVGEVAVKQLRCECSAQAGDLAMLHVMLLFFCCFLSGLVVNYSVTIIMLYVVVHYM